MLKIIVVDDDEEDRNLTMLALQETNISHQLLCLTNGEELYDYLEECIFSNSAPLPDIVFLDLNMPGKSGRDLLVEIKSHSSLKQIRVFIFSTHVSDIDLAFIERAGAAGCITKPPGFGELINILTLICDEVQNNPLPPFVRI